MTCSGGWLGNIFGEYICQPLFRGYNGVPLFILKNSGLNLHVVWRVLRGGTCCPVPGAGVVVGGTTPELGFRWFVPVSGCLLECGWEEML